MPTQRQHGGAALTNFPLTAPGFKGLNLSAKNSLLPQEWATKLQNAIIDQNGRLAARKGWTSQTGTPAGAAFVKMEEYRKHDGTVELVGTTATTVLKSTNNGDTWSNVTGTAVFTSGDWHLVNFNDFLLGFQSGEAPLIYNGTTSSQVADVNAPTGGVGTAAFGRVWCVAADGVELKYSALLDHTDWTSADSGSFDLTNVWPGTDTVKGVAEYNGALVIFGERNILIFVDGSGSALGIDPVNMYVVETITGLGCVSQNSIQSVGGDLWFLGNDYNLHALSRVIQEKSPPIQNLTINVSEELRDSITLTGFNLSDLRSLYSPEERFYLLFLPRGGVGTEVGITWVFDTRGKLEDGSVRCMGRWNNNVASGAAVARANGDLLWGLATATGEVGKYEGTSDNGVEFNFEWNSGWMDITQQSYEIILKRLTGLFYVSASTEVVMKWAWDFQSTFTSKTLSFVVSGSGAEWGIAEWGTTGERIPNPATYVSTPDHGLTPTSGEPSEFAGGVSLQEKNASGRGTGEFIKVGVQATIDGNTFAVQHVDLYAKVGRLR